MKLPLRIVQLSWRATIAATAGAVLLLAVVGLTLDDPLALTLQLAVVLGVLLLLWRHSTPNR